MFEFFKRVKTVVNSELHAMVDKAEDPEKMLDQYLREMATEIREVEAATAKVMAEEKLLGKKVAEAKNLVTTRENQAVQALESENEELARRALEDKNRVAEELQTLEQLHKDMVNNVDDMKQKLKEMKTDFHEMEVKKESLKTRASSAKARTKANHALSSVNNGGAKKGFEKMEGKILRYEAEAETSEDLSSHNRSLDDDLKSLDRNQQIDQELAALKARIANKSKQE
ncbi:PspA/IM30 family protein [Bacillus timonensis]|nr:PspA/IM30 family protein [Bacillus timonensis]